MFCVSWYSPDRCSEGWDFQIRSKSQTRCTLGWSESPYSGNSWSDSAPVGSVVPERWMAEKYCYLKKKRKKKIIDEILAELLDPPHFWGVYHNELQHSLLALMLCRALMMGSYFLFGLLDLWKIRVNTQISECFYLDFYSIITLWLWFKMVTS